MENFLKDLNVDLLTYVFIFSSVFLFGMTVFLKHRNQAHSFTEYSPTLLTSLGSLGTFVGIVVGLLNFDAQNIDGSITALLGGLKTAFITSIVGTGLAIIYRGFVVPFLNRTVAGPELDEAVTAGDLLGVLKKQQ